MKEIRIIISCTEPEDMEKYADVDTDVIMDSFVCEPESWLDFATITVEKYANNI